MTEKTIIANQKLVQALTKWINLFENQLHFEKSNQNKEAQNWVSRKIDQIRNILNSAKESLKKRKDKARKGKDSYPLD